MNIHPTSSKPVLFVIRLQPDTNINIKQLIYIRTQVNYGQFRNSAAWKNIPRRIPESQLDPCHKDTNWNKQPIVAFDEQVSYKTRGNNPVLFIDYTFITHPVALQSIGKCITLYTLRRLFSKWGPRNANGPQRSFPYYKSGGDKTGLDDGKEFGSRQGQHILLFSKSLDRPWGPPCHLMGNGGSVP